jgi:hypothetical protein
MERWLFNFQVLDLDVCIVEGFIYGNELKGNGKTVLPKLGLV